MRSTTPLRLTNHDKITNAGVDTPIPFKERMCYDNAAWEYMSPPVHVTQPKVIPLRKLSPIDESPRSAGDRMKSCSISAQASISPYHSGWMTPQAPPPSRNTSDGNGLPLDSNTMRSDELYGGYKRYEDMTNSPYYPNNNTPTECEVELEQGIYHVRHQMEAHAARRGSSQYVCYPSSLNASVSEPTTAEMVSEISLGTSVNGIVYPPSSRHSSFHPPTRRASVMSDSSDSVSGTLSLPSSIARYHQSRIFVAGNIIMPERSHEVSQNNFNYTLASSVDSTDTQFSEHGDVSMLPNMGSCNTSMQRIPSACFVHSNSGSVVPPSRNASVGDYSRIMHELSSIGLDSDDTNAKMSSFSVADGCSGHSCADLFRSWSATGELDYSTPSSRAITSMNVPHSHANFRDINPERCLSDPGIAKSHSHYYNRNLLHRLSLHNRRVQFDMPAQVTLPILNDKQYWV